MILLCKWKEIAVLLSYALLGFEPNQSWTFLKRKKRYVNVQIGL